MATPLAVSRVAFVVAAPAAGFLSGALTWRTAFGIAAAVMAAASIVVV